MIERLIWALVATACLVGLAGCATAPSTYRAVVQVADDGKSAQWLLPPSANTWNSRGWADSAPSSGYYIDVPLAHADCPYARFPEDAPIAGALQGEIVPATGGTVLRMKSAGAFLDETSLRAAWTAWWDDARKEWPGKCLAADPNAMEEMLVERRPLQFGEILKLYYGFDNVTRTVIIRPGTIVCAADVPYRPVSGSPRFSAAGENCATAMSDGHGGANFSPVVSVLYKFSRLDVTDHKVHAIASWAEIPELKGHLFLLRYPKTMPVSPTASVSAKDAEFPLLIAVDAVADHGAVSRALQCVQGNDLEVGDFCGNKGFGASSCGTALPAGSMLATSRPVCFRFGERGVLTPHVTVLLNGNPVLVPLGTTLGSALEKLSPPTRGIDQHTNENTAALAAMAGVRVTRLFEGRSVVVDVSGAGTSAPQLLLLPGDRISW